MHAQIAADTGGDYGVPTSSEHLRELVLSQVPPRPMPSGAAAPSNALIRVGFPSRQPKAAPMLGFTPGASSHGATVLDAAFEELVAGARAGKRTANVLKTAHVSACAARFP